MWCERLRGTGNAESVEGHYVWIAHAGKEPRIYGDCRDYLGFGHRREYGHLFADEPDFAAATAVEESERAGYPASAWPGHRACFRRRRLYGIFFLSDVQGA